VRLGASPERVTRRAFEKMKLQAEQIEGLTNSPVLEQLEMVLELDKMLEGRK
jgi:hypothetical protein